MRIIEGLLNAYFVIKGISNTESDISKVIVYSAKHKLGQDTFRGKANYSQRKKLGIQTCLEIIASDNRFNEWTTFFNKHTKKDDLSDCFLQGMWFIKYKIKYALL